MSHQTYTRRNFLRASALAAASAALGIGNALAAQTISESKNEKSPPGKLRFPKDFVFGVASSAYQIEGGWNEGGKGESIWDRWCHEGKTKSTGDVACDHYHRYEEDIKVLKQLGVNTYRFSIAWTRIFPEGKGEPNPDGLRFYKEIIRLLKQNRIKPAVTLYHWDLPQKLQDEGGWANPDTIIHFENYASCLFKEFGRDVAYWMTFNEPWVTTFGGYWLGNSAPGVKDLNTALQVSHNILLAHGKTVTAFRKLKLKGKIGIALDLYLGLPASQDAKDVWAAEMINQSHHSWFADPIFKGSYPEMVCQQYETNNYKLPDIAPGDMAIIRQPLDFLGLNYYSTDVWKYDPNGWAPYDAKKVPRAATNPAERFNNSGQPDGLYLLLKRLHERYGGVDIIITENGRGGRDTMDTNGKVNDDFRIKYLYDHLAAGHKAMNDGVNLKGYIVWSFMDDYEWNNFGRIGLVYVDYQSLQRTIKKSGYWYHDCIAKREFSAS